VTLFELDAYHPPHILKSYRTAHDTNLSQAIFVEF